MAGFTFVGRDAWIASFRELLARPKGELLLVTGAEATGKSHLLRRLRREAEGARSHLVQLTDLSFPPDADLRLHSVIANLAIGGRTQGGQEAEGEPAADILPNAAEFFDALITEDRRPPREKLLRVFSAASAHLRAESRLVLLLDLGRAGGEEAFPIEFLARRLPEKIKLVLAAREAPSTAGLDNVTVVSELAPLSEAEVGKLLEFHLSKPAVNETLTSAAFRKFGGHPLATDLAAKLAASAGDLTEALATLPSDPGALCRELLKRLDADRRRFADCLARVPSGVDIASLRALTGFSDSDLRRLLRSDEIRNIVVTQRTARGPQARLFHELLTDQVLAAAPDEGPAGRAFHQRAAAFFLGIVQQDSRHVDALSAHAYHLRLSADQRQFIRDFPKTYKAKHTFRLFRHLADEYTRLIQYCDELGETSINRPACIANLGRVYQELGQNDDALRCHREALELYEKAHDDAGTAEQLAHLASVLQASGQFAEALEHLHRAAKLDEAAANQAALAADYNSLGILCQQLSRPDEALGHHQRALALHQELGNDVGVANQLANLAAIHRARGDPQAARECYQKAWVIDSRTNSTLAQVADLCNLGLVFQDLGDMEKASTCLQQAIELDRTAADREAEAAHLRILASMHQKLGRHDEALGALQQALDIDRSIGNSSGEANGLIALANGYRASGELALARDLLQRALLFGSKMGNADAESAAQRGLENIERLLRGESVEPEAEPKPQPTPSPAVQREPAGEEFWSNLQIVDDGAAEGIALEPEPAAAGLAPATARAAAGAGADEPATSLLELASEVDDTLRRERDQALRRVAELEAELKAYKQIVENLQKILGQASRSD